MSEVQAAMGLPAAHVGQVLGAAALAPSVHNTQPWRFRLTPSAIEMYADRTRLLRVADPEGVEMRMSCGAALFNMRLALVRLGVSAAVTVIPDPAQPEPRCTWSMRPVSVPSSAGCHHRLQQSDPLFGAELGEWSGHTDARGDGVSAGAGGPAPAPRDAWVLRDFTGDRRPEPAGQAGYEEEPLVCVLSVYSTGPAADVRAGEALQRVLLTATVDGLSASLVSQLVEIPEAREQTRQLVGASRLPHAVLRIGYGWPVPVSPRRSIEDVLIEGPIKTTP